MATLSTSIPPLDEQLYGLDSEELAFLMGQTQIMSELALKKHVLEVQAAAYQIYPYPCIRRFSFTKIKIARSPVYQDVLKLGRERPNAILLDLGCCFGNDTRKVIADGFPIDGVLSSDLRKGYWDCGHKLFNSTPESFPVPFIEGDIFDKSILESTPPLDEIPQTPMPSLNSSTSFNPLRGHISVIFTSSFFHLFSEARQLRLAKALAGLLSPIPGSVIFGSQVGSEIKGFKSSSRGSSLFCHSPESWEEVWAKVYKNGKVKVEARLKPIDSDDFAMLEQGHGYSMLVWSVTRL